MTAVRSTEATPVVVNVWRDNLKAGRTLTIQDSGQDALAAGTVGAGNVSCPRQSPLCDRVMLRSRSVDLLHTIPNR